MFAPYSAEQEYRLRVLTQLSSVFFRYSVERHNGNGTVAILGISPVKGSAAGLLDTGNQPQLHQRCHRILVGNAGKTVRLLVRSAEAAGAVSAARAGTPAVSARESRTATALRVCFIDGLSLSFL